MVNGKNYSNQKHERLKKRVRKTKYIVSCNINDHDW